MIKSNLVTIAYEVEDAYKNYYMQWDEFLEEVNEILTYYKSTIYKSGKIIINKKIGNTNKLELDDTDNEFLNEFNYNEFILKLKSGILNCYNNYTKEDLYDQIISIIIGECIILYKQSQIIACKNFNIKRFKLITDETNCCDSCKTLSRFILDTEKFNIKDIHPYCKQFILPLSITKVTNVDMEIASFENIPEILIPIAKKTITKLKIQLKDFISHKKFIFGEFESLISNDDEILIPYNLIDNINFEEFFINELIKNKVLEKIDINACVENYKMRKDSKLTGDICIIYSLPFVNNISAYSCEDYIVESAVKYILDGNKLYDIDKSIYNKLNDLFKKEFIKG